MYRLDRVKLLSFDCYGTLVDWTSGLEEALGQLAARHGLRLPSWWLAQDWESVQFELICDRYRPYREILCDATCRVLARWGVRLSPAEAQSVVESLPRWPVFADVPRVLPALARRYQLVVVSNIDDDLLARTLEHLDVPFAGTVTAQQVQSYKPQLEHFRQLLRQYGLRPEEVLHCAFGSRYDLAPAARLGIPTAWIRRGTGEEHPAVAATVVVDSLEELAQRLGVPVPAQEMASR